MRISAWRIVKARHATSAFTGEGARLHGGRWNSRGHVVVYTAGSCALAALELLVHLRNQQIMQAYVTGEVSFPGRLVRIVDADALPVHWRSDPAPAKLKAIGDKWLADGLSAVLRVPSAVIESEFNYLLNPAHADFAKIKIGELRPFVFDPRLKS